MLVLWLFTSERKMVRTRHEAVERDAGEPGPVCESDGEHASALNMATNVQVSVQSLPINATTTDSLAAGDSTVLQTTHTGTTSMTMPHPLPPAIGSGEGTTQDNMTRGAVFDIPRTENVNKPSFKPDHFNGTTSWIDYKVHFEMCATINGWTRQQMAAYLAGSLRGSAQQVLGDLSPEKRQVYSELVAALSRRFHPDYQNELFNAQL